MKSQSWPTPAPFLMLALLGVALYAAPARAQTFKVIHYFTGGADGSNPQSGLILDSAGNLYGAAFAGGGAGCFDGCGVVFELSPGSQGWSETVLHSFTGGSDGGNPESSLLFDANGSLYGTADVGGYSCGVTYGCGAAFELSPGSGGWTETVLYDFQGSTAGTIQSLVLSLTRPGIFTARCQTAAARVRVRSMN